MASGIRVKRKDSASRRMASRLGSSAPTGLLGDEIASDTGCGLRRCFAAEQPSWTLPYFDHMHRFLIALMLRDGVGVGFVPVNHRRAIGRPVQNTPTSGVCWSSVQDLCWACAGCSGAYRGKTEIREL